MSFSGPLYHQEWIKSQSSFSVLKVVGYNDFWSFFIHVKSVLTIHLIHGYAGHLLRAGDDGSNWVAA